MLNSLLNVGQISIDSLILNIVIILGVVIAGALIVYFLWEAVTALVNKSKKTDSSSDELHFDDDKKADKKENVFVTDYKLDAEPVKEEEPVKEDVVLIDSSKVEDVDAEKAEEEKTEVESQASEEDETAKRRAYLEARRQELIRRMQAEMEEDNSETAETETNSEEEKIEEPVETPVVEEPVAEPVVEEEKVDDEKAEEVEEVPVAEEEADDLDEERKSLAAERERYETMVKELEEAKKALAEQNQEPAQVATVAAATPVLSLDELKQKLAQAEDRLKSTEKEFKQCKKEYIPLRKVWVAHEKDEKKLRRKEALVAKQKVLLYGVNNYSEIDQEKAQKLAEDLDLLDGLKLSVQHCEEVMKKNEERYPLLEKMYNVLKDRNDELKKDIASYKEEIAKLEAEQGVSENEEN